MTARKRAEALQSVPIAITAISGDAIKNQSIRSFIEIQAQTPSLTISQNTADRNSTAVAIRGLVQQDGLITVDPTVGIYYDGVNIAKTNGTELSNLMDIERIEVLKGPQGTLFGRNTIGGAISITSKLPTGVFEGQILARTDIYNGAGGSLILNVPLAGEDLAVRVIGQYDRRDGYGQNRYTGKTINGDLNGGSFRGTLRWKATDRLEVLVRGDYSHSATSAQGWKPRGIIAGSGANIEVAAQQYGTPFLAALGATRSAGCKTAPLTAACATAFATYQTDLAGARAAYLADADTPHFDDTVNNVDPVSTITTWGTSGTINYALSDDISFKSITAYRYLNSDRSYDLDGSHFTILSTRGRTQERDFTQELQIGAKLFDGRLDLLGGGFYSHETGFDQTTSTALPTINPNNPGNNLGHVVNNSKAVFGQGTFRVTDRFSVTAGVRYTKDHKELLTLNTSGVLCNVPVIYRDPGACSASFSKSWSAVSYTASADYKLARDVLVYFRTGKGYRSGGFNLRGTIDPVTFAPFDPETVVDYELGLKSEFFDRHVRLNAAIYQSDYTNIQRTIIVPATLTPTATVVRNAAKGRIRGAEAELTIIPLQNTTLSFTGSYTDPKYLKYLSGTGVDQSKQKFPYVPKWQGSASLAYVIPSASGAARMQVDYSYHSTITFNPESPVFRQSSQRGYGLLNARISKKLDDYGMEFAVYAKNLANKHYYIVGLDLAGSVGQWIGVPGDPRTVGLEVSKKF